MFPSNGRLGRHGNTRRATRQENQPRPGPMVNARRMYSRLSRECVMYQNASKYCKCAIRFWRGGVWVCVEFHVAACRHRCDVMCRAAFCTGSVSVLCICCLFVASDVITLHGSLTALSRYRMASRDGAGVIYILYLLSSKGHSLVSVKISTFIDDIINHNHKIDRGLNRVILTLYSIIHCTL